MAFRNDINDKDIEFLDAEMHRSIESLLAYAEKEDVNSIKLFRRYLKGFQEAVDIAFAKAIFMNS